MRILKICLENPNGARKGDAKLISERTRYLERQTVMVDLLYFNYSLIRPRLSVEQIKRDTRLGVDIIVTISLIEIGWNLISCFSSFRTLPVQTWLSFAIARSTKCLISRISQQYDSIHIYHIRSLGLWVDLPPEKNAIYDIIDSYSLNLRCRLMVEKSRLWRALLNYEYKRMARLESKLENFISNPRSACIVAVASEDLKYIGSGNAKKLVVPVGINIETRSSKEHRGFETLKCVFFGNLDYEPNINACYQIKKLAKAVNTQSLEKQIEFTVAGRNISRRLAVELMREGITVLSPVEDMMQVVRAHNIALMPMVSGSGMQSKVLEALQWGCLLIATQKAVNPLTLENGKEYILWKDIENTLDIFRRLLDGRLCPDEILVNGQSSVKRFSWETTCGELMRLYAGRHI